MERRSWTVLIVPSGSGASRSIEVSKIAVKAVTYAMVFLVVATIAVTYVAVNKTINMSRLESLERTNQLLALELDENEGILAALSDTLTVMTERNHRARNLAGLENTDAAVLQAGIGGPAAPLSADEAFLGTQLSGSRALAVTTDLQALLRRANVLASSFEEAQDSLENNKTRLEHTPSIRPIAQELSWVTSRYQMARFHPVFHTSRDHRGLDIAADPNTPILAPAAGLVIDKGNQVGYGNFVKIDHGNGIVTTFAHTARNLVQVGQRVSRGEEVALVGSTGWATGPHLHYEISVHGEYVDPGQFILGSVIVD
jgi:murein DD-endopeptidase MepM/ murein hydrolase activator NlpD